ncbi:MULTISPECIES: flagellar assembly peptidoglycan hydrolase FlgJ [unclassified Roseateles]|uniref:flagellar assembly peptidoglycan hydrolase FlgJ n=1 Tax=unclassified Roseateles TaxID=2626991 RepID=UPI0006F5DEE9|nr:MULTISPECIES: flagellar assembly peptidoglycan hydrolase FlgJ [unclassified Roseateles]KQW51899.1 glucosaminidase [Pelomonas sp. Root405]KRA78132.1 glucosaminidase [Pelomonas sp. Root662]
MSSSFQSIAGQGLGSLDALKAAASRDPKAQIRETAKQFESLFMQEVMKSMRASTLASGMLDNNATQLGSEMLDTQFAGKMSGLPGGLSEAIQKQLARQMGIQDLSPEKVRQASRTTLAQALPALATKGIPNHVQSFIQQHDAAAKSASASTGIPASFMVAQAAHESGWGKREITGADGTKSHNIFGIKATPGWKGKTVDVRTTEVINGQAVKVTAKFRAYGSYDEAFKDYAKLLGSNDRYAKVVAQAQNGNAAGFARGLQQAGYATDPAYAEKIARTIQTTQRVQSTLMA